MADIENNNPARINNTRGILALKQPIQRNTAEKIILKQVDFFIIINYTKNIGTRGGFPPLSLFSFTASVYAC